jgi:hypothetical protein
LKAVAKAGGHLQTGVFALTTVNCSSYSSPQTQEVCIYLIDSSEGNLYYNSLRKRRDTEETTALCEINPSLFIRGLSCPSCIQASLSLICLKLTIPGFPYNCLSVSCGDIG